jgi:hypothetical protein
MIIEVLSQKYRCGCERGMAEFVLPGILIKLNSIIEWDFCRFPEEIVQEKADPTDENSQVVERKIEKRNFLGDDPELKPGNCFLYKGQVIAVDSEDRLILIVSETGYGALDRIYEENLKTEFEMMFNEFNVEDVKWEVEESGIIPDEFDEVYQVPYNYYNIWKERFVAGRGFISPGLCLKVTMESDTFWGPLDFYMLDWSVRYKSSQLEPDEVEYAVKELLSWFYDHYKRIKALERQTEKEDN